MCRWNEKPNFINSNWLKIRKFCSINLHISKFYQSPTPLSPGATLSQGWRISSFILSWGWGVCIPQWPPTPNLIHAVSKAWALQLHVLFNRNGAFCGKRYWFCVTVACPQEATFWVYCVTLGAGSQQRFLNCEWFLVGMCSVLLSSLLR